MFLNKIILYINNLALKRPSIYICFINSLLTHFGLHTNTSVSAQQYDSPIYTM